MTAYFVLCFLYISTGRRFALMQVKTGLSLHKQAYAYFFVTKSFILTIGGVL